MREWSCIRRQLKQFGLEFDDFEFFNSGPEGASYLENELGVLKSSYFLLCFSF